MLHSERHLPIVKLGALKIKKKHMGKELETENPNAKNSSKSVNISEQAKLA